MEEDITRSFNVVWNCYVAQIHSCLGPGKDGGGLCALYPGENIFYGDASYFKTDFSLYLQLQQ